MAGNGRPSNPHTGTNTLNMGCSVEGTPTGACVCSVTAPQRFRRRVARRRTEGVQSCEVRRENMAGLHLSLFEAKPDP